MLFFFSFIYFLKEDIERAQREAIRVQKEKLAHKHVWNALVHVISFV